MICLSVNKPCIATHISLPIANEVAEIVLGGVLDKRLKLRSKISVYFIAFVSSPCNCSLHSSTSNSSRCAFVDVFGFSISLYFYRTHYTNGALQTTDLKYRYKIMVWGLEMTLTVRDAKAIKQMRNFEKKTDKNDVANTNRTRYLLRSSPEP